MDEGEKVARRLFVTRGNAPKLFDAANESLHQIPFLIQVSVILSLILQVAARRNHRLGATALDVGDEFLAVKALVAEHQLEVVVLQKRFCLRDVRCLARRQLELDRQAQAVDTHVEFRGKSAARTAQRLHVQFAVGTPFFAPAACWWARMTLLSKINHSRSGSCSSRKIRSQTPLRDQRSKRFQTVSHLPNRSGRSRQGAPVLAIQKMASTKSR